MSSSSGDNGQGFPSSLGSVNNILDCLCGVRVPGGGLTRTAILVSITAAPLASATMATEGGRGGRMSPPLQCHHPPWRPPYLEELELDMLTRLVEIMLRLLTMLVVDEYDDSSNCFDLFFVSCYASLSIYAGVNTNWTLTYS